MASYHILSYLMIISHEIGKRRRESICWLSALHGLSPRIISIFSFDSSNFAIAFWSRLINFKQRCFFILYLPFSVKLARSPALSVAARLGEPQALFLTSSRSPSANTTPHQPRQYYNLQQHPNNILQRHKKALQSTSRHTKRNISIIFSAGCARG